jgi:hypothetical protein
MKNTTPTWFGVMLMASAGLVYCGGEDSPLTTPSGSGGGGTRSTTSGPTTVTGVTGTTTAGTTGAGGGATTTVATTTATTTTGAGAGGAGGVGTGGSGTAGNGAGGAVVDAGVCPAAQPAQFAVCTSDGQVCDYPGFACTCMNGIGRDGGMRLAWNCMRVGFDGGMCPLTPPVTGQFCMNVGNVCVYPAETCTCQAGGMGSRWNCL